MIAAIAATEHQKDLLLQKGISPDIIVQWVATSEALHNCIDADILVDCIWDEEMLPLTNKPMLINSTIKTLKALNANGTIARFCGWNSFLERSIWELALSDNADTLHLDKILSEMGWKYMPVKDEPGLVGPRIVSMIINEAYFALAEGISTKEEINIAMQLGTNYPYGPFEWGEKIGIINVYDLLSELEKTDKRYQPAPGMLIN